MITTEEVKEYMIAQLDKALAIYPYASLHILLNQSKVGRDDGQTPRVSFHFYTDAKSGGISCSSFEECFEKRASYGTPMALAQKLRKEAAAMIAEANELDPPQQ